MVTASRARDAEASRNRIGLGRFRGAWRAWAPPMATLALCDWHASGKAPASSPRLRYGYAASRLPVWIHFGGKARPVRAGLGVHRCLRAGTYLLYEPGTGKRYVIPIRTLCVWYCGLKELPATSLKCGSVVAKYR